jgi:hypothetical protein
MNGAASLRVGVEMADRFEREIDEILRKIEDFIPEGGRPPRRQPRKVSQGLTNAQGWVGKILSAISLSQVMLWSLIVFLGAFFLRAIPGAEWLMIGALIVFATAFVLQLSTPGARKGPEKRWRGEPIRNSTGPTWPNRLKAWIKGRKRA